VITSHLLCVKRLDWMVEDRGGIGYCRCGAPLTPETREHAELLHRLLFPSLYDTGSDALSMETI
jgi:hypothetical protein